MNIAIVVIIAFIAVAFFIDAFKQSSGRKNQSSNSERPERIKTADETGPTETGRFRVQQALGATGAAQASESKAKTADDSDDEAPLPDPFDGEGEGEKS